MTHPLNECPCGSKKMPEGSGAVKAGRLTGRRRRTLVSETFISRAPVNTSKIGPGATFEEEKVTRCYI
jgi:hypothetical protein